MQLTSQTELQIFSILNWDHNKNNINNIIYFAEFLWSQEVVMIDVYYGWLVVLE